MIRDDNGTGGFCMWYPLWYMEITKKHWVMAGVGFGIAVLVVAGVTQFISPRRAAAPQSDVSEPAPVVEQRSEESSTTTSESNILPVSTTVSVSQSRSTTRLPAIAKGDIIVSWNFTGAYAGNPELRAKADAEIQRLTGLIGKGTYPDESLFVAIANQYELLGDGKQQYEYLSRAIAIGVGGEVTGLPWHNLGVLMERLGALQTARVDYLEATLAQPQSKQWHFSYLEFLTTRMKSEVTDIEKAFAAAFKNLGQDTDILDLQSEWKKS